MGFSTNRPHRIPKTVCIFFPKKKPNCSHSVKLLPLTAFVVEAIAIPNPSGTISQALIIRNRAALSKFKSHEYQVPNFGPTNFLWGQGHNPPPPKKLKCGCQTRRNSTSGHAARQKIPPLVVFLEAVLPPPCSNHAFNGVSCFSEKLLRNFGGFMAR